MSATVGNILGQHEARLDGHDREIEDGKREAKETRDDVGKLTTLIISTLIAAVGGLVTAVINLLSHGK